MKDFTDFDRNFMEYGGCGCGGSSNFTGCTCGESSSKPAKSSCNGCSGGSDYLGFSEMIDPRLKGRRRAEAIAKLEAQEKAFLNASEDSSEKSEVVTPIKQTVLNPVVKSGSKKYLLLGALALGGFVIYKKFIKK